MDAKRIIMNFTVPPSHDDLEVMAAAIIENIPEELAEHCESLAVVIDEFPDEALEHELELDDQFELMAFYKSGREISPGVELKSANDDDVLTLYRRPILDYWCESCEDITVVLRTVIVEELARNFDFSDDEISEMTDRHYQGMF